MNQTDPLLRRTLFASRNAGDEEFCCICFVLLGFSKKRNVDDLIRFQDDAIYVDGVGQVCSQCNKKKFAGVKY